MKLHAIVVLCGGIALNSVAGSVHAAGTWETSLQARNLDGDPSTFEAYYDTSLNITWLADANYAQTSGYDSDGRMNWVNAKAWAASLNFNGIADWRLPSIIDTGNSGCDFAYTGTNCGYNVDTATGEMAHMFYTTLGNLAFYTTSGNEEPGWGLKSSGPFSNIQIEFGYWSDAEYAPVTDIYDAWGFNFNDGYQGPYDATSEGHAWAVHAGDVGTAAVPVPAAGWLLGSGLLGLVGMGRKRRR